jgi:hypothetical protein
MKINENIVDFTSITMTFSFKNKRLIKVYETGYLYQGMTISNEKGYWVLKFNKQKTNEIHLMNFDRIASSISYNDIMSWFSMSSLPLQLGGKPVYYKDMANEAEHAQTLANRFCM